MYGYFSVAVFRGFVKMFMARRLFFWYTVLGEPYSGPGKIVFLSGQKMAVFLPGQSGWFQLFFVWTEAGKKERAGKWLL
jgi:hypothetical protein